VRSLPTKKFCVESICSSVCGRRILCYAFFARSAGHKQIMERSLCMLYLKPLNGFLLNLVCISPNFSQKWFIIQDSFV